MWCGLYKNEVDEGVFLSQTAKNGDLHHFPNGEENHSDDERKDQQVNSSNECNGLSDRLVVRSNVVHGKVDRLYDRTRRLGE